MLLACWLMRCKIEHKSWIFASLSHLFLCNISLMRVLMHRLASWSSWGQPMSRIDTRIPIALQERVGVASWKHKAQEFVDVLSEEAVITCKSAALYWIGEALQRRRLQQKQVDRRGTSVAGVKQHAWDAKSWTTLQPVTVQGAKSLTDQMLFIQATESNSSAHAGRLGYSCKHQQETQDWTR